MHNAGHPSTSSSSSPIPQPTSSSQSASRSKPSSQKAIPSQTSPIGYRKGLGSLYRLPSTRYNVDVMEKYLKSELADRTYLDVPDLVFTAFPLGPRPDGKSILPFTFDMKRFDTPTDSYRAENFSASFQAMPSYIRPFFEEEMAIPTSDHPKWREALKASDLSGEEFDISDDGTDEKKTGKDEKEFMKWCRHMGADFDALTVEGASDLYTDRHFSHSFNAKGVPGTTPEIRKPDLVLIQKTRVQGAQLYWSRVLAVIEITKKPDFLITLMKELPQRATLIFKNCPGCRFVVILAVSARKFMLCIYHRSGASFSEKFDIVKNEAIFYYIIAALYFAPEEYIGFPTDMKYTPIKGLLKSIDFKGETYTVTDDIKPIVIKDGIQCRGTVCFSVIHPRTGVKLVFKVVWIDEDAPLKEVDFHERISEYEIEGTTIMVGYEDCVCNGGTMGDSTSIWNTTNNKGFKIRYRRKTLLMGLGRPIVNFSTKKELLSAAKDILLTLKRLKRIGILHCDVSLSNIMLIDSYPKHTVESLIGHLKELTTRTHARKGSEVLSASTSSSMTVTEDINEDPSPQRGFLADFDFSCLENKNDGGGFERTGTLPFMAIQVLLGYAPEGKKFRHTLQMDIESLLYDLLFIGINYAGPKGLVRNFKNHPAPEIYSGGAKCPTEVWSTPGETLVQLGLYKLGNMAAFKKSVIPWLSPYFSNMDKFFIEYFETLFPRASMPPEDYDQRVCSPATIDQILVVVRNHKAKMTE